VNFDYLMDSFELSELQTFFAPHQKKSEYCSDFVSDFTGDFPVCKQQKAPLYVPSVDCVSTLDLLDPALERALDLRDFIPGPQAHNSQRMLNTDQSTDQSLPQVVLDATTLVHGDRYTGETSVLPPAVVNFLEEQQRSPAGSDASSYLSEESNHGIPEFLPHTSPTLPPAVPTSHPPAAFQWPNFSQLKQEEFNQRTEDFLPDSRADSFPLTPCQPRQHQPHPSSLHSPVSSLHSTVPSSLPETNFPFVTSPSASLPSPTSTVYSASSPGTPGPSAPRGRRPHGSGPYAGAKSRRRTVEKGTQEYVDKRARNNVAVRKSRAKAKEKQRETEGRVQSLLDQNDQLQKKVDLLTKELNVLKGLFLNIGASIPDEFLKLIGDTS